MAIAVFSILMYIEDDNEVDFSKSQYIIVDKERAENGVWSSNISNGTYYFITYDIICNNITQIEGLPSRKVKLNISGTFTGMLIILL